MEPIPSPPRPGAMPNLLRRLTLPVVVLTVLACGGAGPTASPSSSIVPATAAPSVLPSPSSGAFGAIDHATGATDVLLRYEFGGGFVPPDFLATQAPAFTLYGDGTVIFQSTAPVPPPAEGASVVPKAPFRTATLTEEQIQATLEFALGQGGLGIARLTYDEAQVADAPTATFTVNAGGLKKTVSVYALGMETQGPDRLARAAFQRLADRLGDFDQGGSVATDAYRPAAFRGILAEGSPAADQIAWPWKGIAPADFPFPADPNAFQSARRVLTPDDVAALGIKDVGGGFIGLPLLSPDGRKTYSLSLRPLLPDESA